MPVEDEDGDHDRLEELRCEMFLDSAQVRFDAYERIWSDRSLEAWFIEVEASEGFAALIAAESPSSISVEQSWR
jgi:hypothetical protein